VVEPWAPSTEPRAADVPELVDPWQGGPSAGRARVPTRSFLPVDVIDPWAVRAAF
jgi:hypothetical protein